MKYKGRYNIFDAEQIVTYPVCERPNKVKLNDLIDPGQINKMNLEVPQEVEDKIILLAKEILSARENNRPVIFFTGAHLVKNGLSRLLGNLTKKNHDAWRQGKVPYLERVFEGSLSKANRILRIIGFHAHALNMVPNITQYNQRGKGKKHLLRFSKSGDRKIEEAYSKHFYWNQSPEKKLQMIDRAKPEQVI